MCRGCVDGMVTISERGRSSCRRAVGRAEGLTKQNSRQVHLQKLFHGYSCTFCSVCRGQRPLSISIGFWSADKEAIDSLLVL